MFWFATRGEDCFYHAPSQTRVGWDSNARILFRRRNNLDEEGIQITQPLTATQQEKEAKSVTMSHIASRSNPPFSFVPNI